MGDYYFHTTRILMKRTLEKKSGYESLELADELTFSLDPEKDIDQQLGDHWDKRGKIKAYIEVELGSFQRSNGETPFDQERSSFPDPDEKEVSERIITAGQKNLLLKIIEGSQAAEKEWVLVRDRLGIKTLDQLNTSRASKLIDDLKVVAGWPKK